MKIQIVLLKVLICGIYFSESVLCQTCQNPNELYNFAESQCQTCHENCSTCSSFSPSDCLTCQSNFYRFKYDNSCIPKCTSGMYMDNTTQTCDLCSVYGCDTCSPDQTCLNCRSGLQLDEVSNLCKIKQDMCSNEQVFSFQQDQCLFTCEKNLIQDSNTKLCGPIQNCSQIIEEQSQIPQSNFEEIGILSNGLIVILRGACKFYFYDSNLNLVDYIELQSDSIKPPSVIYSYSKFIFGDIGGCINQQRIISLNLITRKLEFNIEDGLNNQYSIVSIFQTEKLIILFSDLMGFIIYDYHKKISEFVQQEQRFLGGFYQINQAKQVYLQMLEKTDNQGIITNSKVIYIRETQQFYEIDNYKIDTASFSQFNQEDNTFIAVFNYLKVNTVVLYQLSNDLLQVNILDEIQGKNCYNNIIIEEKKTLIFNDYKTLELYLYKYDSFIKKFKLALVIQNQILSSFAQLQIIKQQNDNYQLLVLAMNKVLYLIDIDNITSSELILQECLNLQLSFDAQTVFFKAFFLNGFLHYFVNTNQQQLLQSTIQIGYQKLDFLGSNKFQKLSLQSYISTNFKVTVDKSDNQQLIKFVNNDEMEGQSYIDFKLALQSIQINTIKRKITNPTNFDNQKYQSKDIMVSIVDSLVLRGVYADNKLKLYFSDTQNQIVSSFFVDIKTTVSQTNFIYISTKKLIFIKDNNSLINMENGQRVSEFSIENSDKYRLSKAVFQNYQDKKLLCIDTSNILFSFDFDLKQYQQHINDGSNVSLIFVRCYINNVLSLISINNYIYLIINNLKIVQFSLETNSFTNNQILLPQNFDNTHFNRVLFYQNFIFILQDLTLKKYDENLVLSDTFTLPTDTLLNVMGGFVDSFYMFYGNLRLYRLDLNTKQFVSLYGVIGGTSDFIFISNSKIMFNSSTFIQYQEMILLTFFNYKKIYLKIQQPAQSFNQQNFYALYDQANSQFVFIRNIQNDPIVKFSLSTFSLISTIFTSKEQISYYYDQTNKKIIKSNILKQKQEQEYPFSESFVSIYVDSINGKFIYKQADLSVKVFNPNSPIDTQISLIKQFTGITRLEHCPNLQLVIVQTTTNQIIIYQYNNPGSEGFTLDLSDALSLIKSSRPLRFQIQCSNNLIYIESPILKFFTLGDGKLHTFQITDYINYMNGKTSSPLVNLEKQLIIYPHSSYGQYIMRNDQISVQNLFSYAASVTKLYYDYDNNILLAVTGTLKLVNVVNCQVIGPKYTFTTTNTFLSTGVDAFIPSLNLLIIIDSASFVYLYNYILNTYETMQIYFSGCQSIIEDLNNSFIYVQTLSTVHVYSFPQFVYIKSFYDSKNVNNSNIKSITFLPASNILYVIRQDSSISVFDLAETLIKKIKYIEEDISFQYLQFENSIVSYSLYDSALFLIEDSIIQDQLFIDASSITYYIKCELFQINENSLIQITNKFILIIKINFAQKKLELMNKVVLKVIFTDSVYDYFHQVIYLIDSSSQNIFKLQLNQLEEGIKQIGQLKYDYSEIIISKSNLIYTKDNKVISHSLMDLSQQNEISLGNSNPSVIFKLNRNKDVKFDDSRFEFKIYNEIDDQNQQLILIVQNLNKRLFIINHIDLSLECDLAVDYDIANIVIDRKRELIFSISSNLITYIYNFKLSLLSQIQNPCLQNTKIYFDDQFIYAVCPNSVLFYNAITLEKQKQQIVKGYTDISSIKSFNKFNSFLLIQNQSIQIIQFYGSDLSQIRIIFQRDKKYMNIFKMEFITDINNQIYITLQGASWFDYINYIIPFEKSASCLSSFKSQSQEITNNSIQIIQQNAISSNQQIKQIYLQYENNRTLDKIKNLQAKQSEIQLIMYSLNKESNTIAWQDGSIADDQYVQELIIQDMSLKLQNNMIINQNNNIKKLLIMNVDIVDFDQQIIIQNIDLILFIKVRFMNFKYQFKAEQESMISFKNCGKIIFQDVDFLNLEINSEYLINFQQIQEIQFKQLNIVSCLMSNFIVMQKISMLSITNSNFKDLNNQDKKLIQGSLVDQININFLTLKNISNQQLFQFIGCFDIVIDQVNIINSLNLVILQTYSYQEKLIYPSINVSISNLNAQQSKNIHFDISSINFVIKQSYFSEIEQRQVNLIDSSQTNISFIDCQFSNMIINEGYSIIRLNTYNNLELRDIQFSSSKGNLINLLNQNSQYSTQFSNLIIIDSSSLQLTSLMVINLVNTIVIEDSEFTNSSSSSDGGIYKIENCSNLTIKNSKFSNNISTKGLGGCLFLNQIQNILVEKCEFIENQSLSRSGGAIFIDSQQILNQNLKIINCQFNKNKALLGYGGALSLLNADLHFEQTTIEENEAAIGGGIYYQQLIPNIIENKQISQYQNVVQNNKCSLYGRNIGSTLRKIKVNKDSLDYDIKMSEFDDNSVDKIELSNFKSGEYLYVKSLQLIDEEENPFQNDEIVDYDKDVDDIIQTTVLNIDISDEQYQIKFFGSQITNYKNQNFSFNVSISYKPSQSAPLQIKSQLIPSLYNSKGEIYIQEKFLQLLFEINFRDCVLGEIQQEFLSSIICEQCPDGKYSLKQKDQMCQICPTSAVKCYGSNILLKNGYWRVDEQSDQIVECFSSPENCATESDKSKKGCAEGYVGPLCESCDITGSVWGFKYANSFSQFQCNKCSDYYTVALAHMAVFIAFLIFYINLSIKRIVLQVEKGLISYYLKKSGLLYLSNSTRNLNSTIYSKILIDHLQIISIVSSFQLQLPSIFSYSSNIGGNPMQINSNSMDCFYESSQRHMPLWFMKMLWSACLPFIIFFAYYFIVYMKQKLRNIKIHSRYNQTAIIFIYLYFYPSLIFLFTKSLNCVSIGGIKYAQIDLLIPCRDKDHHLLYGLFFSVPSLIITCILIPMFIFKKIKQTRQNNFSKIQKSHYQFIYDPYKDDYYYWEFVRLLYKALVMILSILLSQDNTLKACTVNSIVIGYFYFQMKINPYTVSFFNYLESQSTIICILTLNLCNMYQQLSETNSSYNQLISSVIILFNFYFIVKMLLLTFLKPIPSKKSQRNMFQEFLYNLKMRFPFRLTVIQIGQKINFSTFLKIRKIRSYFKNMHLVRKERSDLQFSQIKGLTEKQFAKQQQPQPYLNEQHDEVNSEYDESQQNQINNIHRKYTFCQPFKSRVSSQFQQPMLMSMECSTEKSLQMFTPKLSPDRKLLTQQLTSETQEDEVIETNQQE